MSDVPNVEHPNRLADLGQWREWDKSGAEAHRSGCRSQDCRHPHDHVLLGLAHVHGRERRDDRSIFAGDERSHWVVAIDQ
jgi:hypothetical protein